MNVTFEIGEKLPEGYILTSQNGLSEFIAESEYEVICFRTDAGEGINYSQIQWMTDKVSGRQYRSMRFLIKRVALVQAFSNQLYQKWKAANDGKDALLGLPESRNELVCPVCKEAGRLHECCGEE